MPEKPTYEESKQGAQSLMYRVIVYLILPLFILVNSSSFGYAKEKIVKIGVYENPPILYKDKDEKYKGIAVEILEHIASEVSWELEYVPGTWSECLKRLENGQIDVQVYIAHTEKRAKIYDFTNETIFSNWGQVFIQPDSEIDSILDLNQKTVALLNRATHNNAFKELIKKLNINCKLIEVENNNAVFKLIDERKVDAGVVNRVFGDTQARKYKIKKTSIIFNPIEVRYALPKGKNHDLAVDIDKHLSRLKKDKDSVYYRLIDNTFGYRAGNAIPIWLKWVFYFTGGILLAIIFVIILLKHQVNSKTKELKNINQNLEKQIVDRFQAEENLKKSENRLHSFLSNSPVGIGIWDREFRYVYINEILQKINGPSLKEHIGKTIEEVLPKAAPIIRPIFETILSKGKPVLNIELSGEVPATPEKITHYLLSYFPIMGKTKTVEYIGGIIIDITDRKNAEEKLRQQKKLFKTIIDNIPALITLYNPETQVLLVNNSFETTVGWTNEDLKTIDIMEVCYPDPEYRAIAAEYMQRASNEWQEFSLKTKSGHSFDSIWSNVRLEDGTQVGIGINISDKKKLEKSLVQAQKMESIGTLAGGIAHDFNNILSSVIGYTELALDRVDEGSDVEDDLQEVRKAGLRAKDLVKQILTFARQSEEKIQPIQVNIIAKEVVKFIKSSIPTSIQIKNSIISDSLIMGSPTQIHQILMNLCTNAAQAMEENGGILEVSVNDITIDKMAIPDLKPGEYIEIKVTDTGEGISPQHIHTIFEPYFTTKPVGEGTGMGLAVVHGIVENYGGKITANSAIDKGTCFTIYLPITKKRKVYTRSEKEDLPFGNEKILFIDDEAPIAKMGSKILEQLGYAVTTRTSSVEALELFRSKPKEFDLVISDMTMPNMTGDQLAAEMMNIRSDIPVVLCTGYSKKISEESAAEIGIKALVYKPVVKSDLAKTVRKVLDQTNSSE